MDTVDKPDMVVKSRLPDAVLFDLILDDNGYSRKDRQACLNELLQRIKNKDDDSASTRYWKLIEMGKSAADAIDIIKVHDQLLKGVPVTDVRW